MIQAITLPIALPRIRGREFGDNFSSLKEWTVVSGTWNSQNGVLSNSVSGMILSSWRPGLNFEVEASLDTGAASASIIWASSSGQDDYEVQFDQSASNRALKIYKEVAGTFTLLGQSAAWPSDVIGYTPFTFRKIGDKLIGLIRDIPVIEVTDTTNTGLNGFVGFRTNGATTVKWIRGRHL